MRAERLARVRARWSGREAGVVDDEGEGGENASGKNAGGEDESVEDEGVCEITNKLHLSLRALRNGAVQGSLTWAMQRVLCQAVGR